MCSASAPSFEVKKSGCNKVAECVGNLVIRSLHNPVPLGRDDRDHSLLLRVIYNRVGVVPLVGQKVIGAQTVDPVGSMRTIRVCILSDNDSDRQTMRIHGQMYLGIESPCVRLMSWFAPFAPAACGWTLQWLASNINHS